MWSALDEESPNVKRPQGREGRVLTRRTLACSISAALGTVGLVVGDAAMLGVAISVKRMTTSLPPQILLATVVISLGSYLLFGWPQLRAWRNKSTQADKAQDLRLGWAVRALGRGGIPLFIVGSILGGPLAVGWYAGCTQQPRGRIITWTASLIFGAFWAVVYLRFGLWALVVVVAVAAVAAITHLAMLRRTGPRPSE